MAFATTSTAAERDIWSICFQKGFYCAYRCIMKFRNIHQAEIVLKGRLVF